jgi:4-hydroxybenzoate polyprenyltransferase
MAKLGAAAKRFTLTTAACAVVLVAVGVVFGAVAGTGTQASVASALFIGAALLILVNALGEGGVRDRGVDVRTGMTYPGAGLGSRGSLGWVLVGIALIAVGLLVLVL